MNKSRGQSKVSMKKIFRIKFNKGLFLSIDYVPLKLDDLKSPDPVIKKTGRTKGTCITLCVSHKGKKRCVSYLLW